MLTRTLRTRAHDPGRRRSDADRSAPVNINPTLLHAPDGLLLFAAAGLVSVGLIMVYSVTAGLEGVNLTRKLAMQFGMGGLGLLAGLVVPLHTWRKLTPVAMFGVIVALISLLVPGNPLAVDGGGAVRWLGVGSSVVQPSEFAKLAFILYAAAFLAKRGAQMKLVSGYQYWKPFLGLLLLILGLIYLEPDLGTALALGGTVFCMLWLAGVDWKALLVGILAAAIVVGVAVTFKEHQRARLLSWWNPWEHHQDGGHQVIQSWTALSRGGWFGVGLGNSLQKLDDRLPEAETDFIFAVVGEELGLLRASGVVLLFILFAWRGYAISARAPDRYTSLLAGGVTSWIAFQSGMNLAVVTGSIPNTGVPLPLISSGGSSSLALLTGVGILVAISRRTRPGKEARS